VDIRSIVARNVMEKRDAKGHHNQLKLKEYYTKRLTKKYGKYPFVKNLNLKVDLENNMTKVSIRIGPEKGSELYVSASDFNENKASELAIKRMNGLIEKYKEQYYHKKGATYKSE
jgi:ribosome-associated translation inhibitor RaiA